VWQRLKSAKTCAGKWKTGGGVESPTGIGIGQARTGQDTGEEDSILAEKQKLARANFRVIKLESFLERPKTICMRNSI